MSIYLTTKDVSVITGYSVKKVRRLLRKGIIPGYQIVENGHWRIGRRSFVHWHRMKTDTEYKAEYQELQKHKIPRHTVDMMHNAKG